jgi:hypothetical protein
MPHWPLKTVILKHIKDAFINIPDIKLEITQGDHFKGDSFCICKEFYTGLSMEFYCQICRYVVHSDSGLSNLQQTFSHQIPR